MNRIFLGIFTLLTACAACFGQSTYKGLMPGKSTRVEAERVLGRPVKGVSATLLEYKEPADLGRPEGVDRVYVQYREASPAAIIERIELLCDAHPGRERRAGCYNLFRKLTMDVDTSRRGREVADMTERDSSGVFKRKGYYGPPVFLVRAWSTDKEAPQDRLGLYSPELFESSVPKSCTGTFLGEWETNRGRLILTDVPGVYRAGDWGSPETTGTYTANGGTVTGSGIHTLIGEWKDATGSGTFELEINIGHPYVPALDDRKVFTGTWERTSGKGPKKGKWEGRCVETGTGN